MIPCGKLRNRMAYLCSKNGIELLLQEESYTSVSSFFDLDPIPVHSNEEKEYNFSGKNKKRIISNKR